ncbi:MAG TPA: type I DNA topoisomerase [Thermomicrobiales bacterium]|nr:type I DNA topoisomerase [Thermomicrobiales bacterium]
MTDTKIDKPVKKTPAKKKTAAASVVRPKGKLVIVESPTKAKAIGRYLGSGYTVKSSMGHVRDLPKSTMGVNVDDDFTPKYLIPREKIKTIKDLKSSVQGAKELILATDPDREGEAIAWHLVQATEPGDKPISRVVFHEITPEAVQEAMRHPREIDMALVDAQQARRVLDRLVGYSVSPLLWKKVKRGLSAGRVQSAALRIVVDRERLIEAFVPVEYWSVEADLKQQEPAKPVVFRAAVNKVNGKNAELATGEEAHRIVDDLRAGVFRVAGVKTRETQRRPQAPFTTSTLQQEASRKLGYPVRRTMQVAQELYEGIDLGKEGIEGLITYMRTDSLNLSAQAQQAARAVISGKYGPEFVPESSPVYKTRSKGAQEAHEAIRPTHPSRDPASVKSFLTPQQFKLYQLIWQRFIASQMMPAILDGTTIDIAAGQLEQLDKPPYMLRATGSVVKFLGYMKVYTAGRDDGDVDELDKGALPRVTEGEFLDLLELFPEQHFTQPPPRYSEATLIKALEEEGIGRPSTYAPTLATLLARSYITTEQKKLIPTELGAVVSDLLAEHFPNVFDIGFTSQMENELDDIASGDRAWVPTLRSFYDPFKTTLAQAEQTIQRVKLKDEPAGEDCEQCGRPMVIKMGKFGKFMACSGFPECRNSKPLLTKIGMTCPTCHEGDVVERRSKKGRTFYGCSRYPDCDFVTWNKPVETKCPRCGSHMEEVGRQGQLKCPACGHVGAALPAAG